MTSVFLCVSCLEAVAQTLWIFSIVCPWIFKRATEILCACWKRTGLCWRNVLKMSAVLQEIPSAVSAVLSKGGRGLIYRHMYSICVHYAVLYVPVRKNMNM